MKLLFILLVLTSSAFAGTDYHCQVRNYIIDLELSNDRSTGVFITNRWNHDTLHVGYAGSIERGKRVTSFYFYGRGEPTILSFLNEEIKKKPNKLKAHIEAGLEGFYFTDYFTCTKK